MARANRDGGQAIEEAVENPHRTFPKPLAGAGLEALSASTIGVRANGGEAGKDADGAGRREHREIMAIDLILERAFPNLVEAIEFERDAAAVRPEDAVKGNGEPLLIGPGNGLDRTDDPRAAGDQDPLAVSGNRRGPIRWRGPDRETRR